MQYRGSDGFGKEFLHAGDKQWAAAMQVLYFPTPSKLIATLSSVLEYLVWSDISLELPRFDLDSH